MGHTPAAVEQDQPISTREFAVVVLGGRPIAFAYVRGDIWRGTRGLLTQTMFHVPPTFAPDPDEETRCPCRSEDLAFATIRPLRGGSWTLGVKVCLRHGLLHEV
jgi:hypothetical protein